MNRLLSKFRYVRDLVGKLDAAERHCAILRDGHKESSAAAESLLGQLADAEEKLAELQHSLEVERTKRIASEQIAVSRGNELDWLRDQYSVALASRDSAVSERVQSLDLVNVTLLKQQEAEAPPTKEQMAAWRPIPKTNRQAVQILRKAQGEFMSGLHKMARKASQPAAPVEERAD